MNKYKLSKMQTSQFIQSCKTGNFEDVKQFEPTVDYVNKVDGFLQLCRYNHFEILQWIAPKVYFDTQSIDYVFEQVCFNGSIELFDWCCQFFKQFLVFKQMSYANRFTFAHACINEQFELAEHILSISPDLSKKQAIEWCTKLDAQKSLDWILHANG